VASNVVMPQNDGYLYLFVLVEKPNESWLQRLKNSATLNGRTLSFQYAADGSEILCTCLLDGVIFGSHQSTTRSKAKLMSVKKTVQIMESIYPRLEVTSVYNTTKMSTLNLNQDNFDQLLIHEMLAFACDAMTDVLSFKVSAGQNQQLDAIHQAAYTFSMKSNAELKSVDGGGQEIIVWITKQIFCKCIIIYVLVVCRQNTS
jgi:hypothetical protein